MTSQLKILVLLHALVLLTACHGQTGKQEVNTANNVAGEVVTALGNNIMVIHQAKGGIYWFGSWDRGVYRFDGESIINYTTEHGLSSNRIDEIQEDKFGNIYFNSCDADAAIIKYDGTTFSELIPTVGEWDLQEDDLWFRHSYENEHIVYRYDGSSLYELQFPKPPNLSNPFSIYSIYKDTKGNLWFGTNPVGVCRYNGTSFDWITEEDVTEFRDGGANGVRSIAEDRNGDFWFNTEYRYRVYDPKATVSTTFYSREESIGSLDGLPQGNLNEYLSIIKDNDQNLWIATYRDGVWKYDGEKITRYDVKDGGSVITVFSVYKDNGGTIWVGTQENGAYRFNGEAFEKFVR